MTTVRTVGIYMYLVAKGAPTSSNDLARDLGGDRKTYLKDIQAMVKAGLLKNTTQIINGRPVKLTYLTDVSPLNGLQILLSQLNSNINHIAYSLISKKEYIRERMGEYAMSDYEPSPMWLEPDERAEYARRAREERDREYRASKEATAKARIKEQQEKTPDMWSTDDSAHYFADRMESYWHIAPWLTVKTRFKAAFGKCRRIHGTTGDVEKKMIDRFFSTLEHHKSLDNPEIIWKMFINQFPALQLDVLRTTVTADDIAEAQAVADKQWGDLGV